MLIIFSEIWSVLVRNLKLLAGLKKEADSNSRLL